VLRAGDVRVSELAVVRLAQRLAVVLEVLRPHDPLLDHSEEDPVDLGELLVRLPVGKHAVLVLDVHPR
jgi:hypothetical protein